MATKDKYSFSIDGVKYNDIKGSAWGDGIYINVGGTSQMILQWMKQKYPNLPKTNYYWIKSSSFANGNSIDVYLNNAPQEFASKLRKELEAYFEYGTMHYSSQYAGTKMKTQTDEGKRIDYGTKYLRVENYPPYGAKSEAVDWASVLEEKAPKPAPTQQRSYPMGEVLQNCSGWIVSKKTLPDGRIVYNAKIKPDTPKNKGDWNQIKGEIYVQTGFKWGKFSSFDKWGQIERESEVLAELCKILGQYYVKSEPQEEAPKEEPKQEIPQEKTSEKVKIYENGTFQVEVEDDIEASKYLKKVWGEKAYQSLIDNYQIQYDDQDKRLDYILYPFYYGEQSKVPSKLGNELLFSLIYKGYKVRNIDDGRILIFKDKIGRETLKMFEKAENLVFQNNINDEEVGSVNYVINGQILSPSTLASVIDKIYYDTFEGEKREEEPQKSEEPSQEMSKEKIEKAIAALKILAANGNEKAKSGIIALQYLLNK